MYDSLPVFDDFPFPLAVLFGSYGVSGTISKFCATTITESSSSAAFWTSRLEVISIELGSMGIVLAVGLSSTDDGTRPCSMPCRHSDPTMSMVVSLLSLIWVIGAPTGSSSYSESVSENESTKSSSSLYGGSFWLIIMGASGREKEKMQSQMQLTQSLK